MEFIKIVFTGGPCAGKTKLIEKTKKYFRDNNYNVITVPETATILLESGINFNLLGSVIEFQKLIYKMQLNNEKLVDDVIRLKKDKKFIILYDRGILDNKAYCDKYEDFDFIIDDLDNSEIDLLDNYNLVFDLITTADCAPEKYTLSTNKQRTETIEEAKILDEKTSNAWAGHRNLKIINSNISIDDAFLLIKEEIECCLKGEQIKENKKVFLENKIDDFVNYNDNNSRLIKIQEIVLNIPISNLNFILYKRTYKDNSSYVIKIFSDENDIQTIYYDEKISHNTYLELIEKYKIRDIINYEQLSFIENRQEYKIKFYEDYTLLEYEENKLNEEINFPNNIIFKEKKETIVKNK